MPWARASVKIVGAVGLDRGASIRAAPSNSEYSVWVCRWTNCSAAVVTAPSRHLSTGSARLWTTYTHVIRRGPNVRPGGGGVKGAGRRGRAPTPRRGRPEAAPRREAARRGRDGGGPAAPRGGR